MLIESQRREQGNQMKSEPSNEDLDRVDSEIESELSKPLAAFDPLEDLFTDAILAEKNTPTRKKYADPSMRDSLAAVSKKMKEVFSLPENWERTRGLAMIDKASGTLIGNFSEYTHRTVKGCRKLLREYALIEVSGTEYFSGWLGESMKLKRENWDTVEDVHSVQLTLWLDELMVGSPEVKVVAFSYLGGVRRVELSQDTQFAGPSGNLVITLPKDTNVWEAMDVGSKMRLRKEIGL